MITNQNQHETPGGLAEAVATIEQNDEMHMPRTEQEIQSEVSALSRTLAAAKRVERELGPDEDFEWGTIYGKLSALRWVLGDDWDQLNT